jgi:hypothetical protein
MTGPPPPETLLALLAELDRIRALAFQMLERSAPQLPAEPPDGPSTERTVHDLLIGARRAVLGNPAAARGLYDLLVGEGRRYATTPEGAALRDALAGSAAVDHLRRIWETVSLNALDGPAPPDGVPDAWAELLAEAVTGNGIDAALARMRPEGFVS